MEFPWNSYGIPLASWIYAPIKPNGSLNEEHHDKDAIWGTRFLDIP
jgi:hypothetical protein